MNAMVRILIMMLSLAGGTSSGEPPIRYAKPADFTGVPDLIIRRLALRGCTIPQSGADVPLENLISGHYLAKNRLDFAALCSRGGASDVIVIDGSTGAVIVELNRQKDSAHLMPVDGRVLFMRTIRTSEGDGESYCFDLDEPCPCDQTGLDGILDSYEKWSETHCWKNGWHTVVSGD